MHPTPPRARTVRRALAALASSAAALAATTSAANAAPPPVIQSPAAAPPSGVVTPTTQSIDLTGVVAPATRGATGVTGAEAQAQAAAAGAEAVVGQSTGEVNVQRFGMAAASWLPDPAVRGVVVEVRTRTAGTWSSWTSLAAHDDASARATRTGTDPVWVGAGADGVEARVASFTAAAPRGLRVDLIEPGNSSAEARKPLTTSGTADPGGATATATAAVSGPAGVITRAGWGADESIRTSCAPGGPDYTGTPKVAVIHHTAGSNYYSAADSAAIIRGIYAYHGQTLGWCDIGYNFMIDKFGQIFEGRAGGMDKAVYGAHAGGFNQNTFGVAVIGDYTQTPATAAGIEAFSKVIAYKFALSGTDPYGTATLRSDGSSYTMYPAGTFVTKPTIVGHQDVGYTADPGDFEGKLGQIRSRVAQLIPQQLSAKPPVAQLPVPLQPNALLWQVRNTASPGAPDAKTFYGSATSFALSCDFNGDGRADIATYDRGRWYIRYEFAGGSSGLSFDYGWTTGIPVCGKWAGGAKAGIGVFENGVWYLKNLAGPGPADRIISYGFTGALPVVGDWNGDGSDTLGVYSPTVALWMLRNSNTPGIADAGVFTYGWRTATPVVGDFNGDGRSDIGVFDSGAWWLRNSPTPGMAQRIFNYGGSGYLPVTGNFGGGSTDGIGVITKAYY